MKKGRFLNMNIINNHKREKWEAYFASLDENIILNNKNNSFTINIEDLVQAIQLQQLQLTDIFNKKYLYTYFQFEDDLYRNLRLNNTGYKFYILKAKISKNGNFYITNTDGKRTYINLENKVKYDNGYYSIVVLLSPNDFKGISENEKSQNIFQKTDDLPSNRIFYLENHAENMIKQLEQSLLNIPYFNIQPFQEGKEVILVPYFSDLSADLLFQYGRTYRNPINLIMNLINEDNRIKELTHLNFTFSVFSKETFKYDEPILNDSHEENFKKELHNYIPLHYECLVCFKDVLKLRSAFAFIKKHGYLKAKLTFINDKVYDMSGQIFFSCGISEQDRVYIKVQNQVLDSQNQKLLKTFYELPDLKYCSTISFLDSIACGEIEDLIVYNVGHGECSLCKVKDNNGQLIHLFFDYGHSFFKDDIRKKHIKKAIDEVKSLAAHIIILSHWDNDHILFFTDGKIDIIPQECYFIVPDLSKLKTYERSSTAIRIFKKLIDGYLSKTAIIDITKVSQIIYDKGHFQISTGQFMSSSDRTAPKTKKYSYRVTRMNNNALIVKVNGQKTILFPGDCDYKKMYKNIMNEEYDVLIVSHHGALIGIPPHAHGIQEAKAIVCCSNHYNEPRDETTDNLKNNGYHKRIVFKDIKDSKISI